MMNTKFEAVGYVVVDYEDEEGMSPVLGFGATAAEAMSSVALADRSIHLDPYPASAALFAAAVRGRTEVAYRLNVDGILFLDGEQFETDGERAKSTFLREREAEATRHYDNAGAEERAGRHLSGADFRRAGDLSMSVFNTDK